MNDPCSYRTGRSFRRQRHGGVAVEFAIVAPIFFLVLLGGIEFTRVHITQCAMDNAAFEGARAGIVPGAQADDCSQIANDLLQIARIAEFDVSVDPPVIENDTDAITVTVTVPMTTSNKFGISGFMDGRTLTRSISLPRQIVGDPKAEMEALSSLQSDPLTVPSTPGVDPSTQPDPQILTPSLGVLEN